MIVLLQGITGLIFGLGLVIAGMSNPAKVLNFLDFAAMRTGGWDPSLAFVLAGAVVVTSIGYRLLRRREKPLFDGAFQWPQKQDVDRRLVTGAAVFGIGWGMAGFCPGPAFTSLASGLPSAVLFVIAMLAGMVVARMGLAVERNQK